MTMSLALTRDDEGVVRLVMQDEAGQNALSERFARELGEALRSVACDPLARVLVLEGLPDVFCSGASRELLDSLAVGGTAPTDILLPKQVLELPIPVIAAMEGHAIGGGFALGLCADLVLIARESRYGCNFMNMGFTPGMGVTRLLEHVLSPALAHELMLTGELRRGQDFFGHSGINYVLPRSEVAPKAVDLARRIAEKPRQCLTLLKRTLSLPRRVAFETSLTLESLMHEVSLSAPDVRHRIEEAHLG